MKKGKQFSRDCELSKDVMLWQLNTNIVLLHGDLNEEQRAVFEVLLYCELTMDIMAAEHPTIR